MRQIRANIFEVTHSELGAPTDKGTVALPDSLGTLHLNDADLNYISKHSAQGFEPIFFVSKSDEMGGDFVVVGRQQKA